MKTTPRARSPWACALLAGSTALLLGCPARPSEGGAKTPTPTATPQSLPTPKPSAKPSPEASARPDPGVAGPAPRRHPHPDDGIPGTDYLQTRDISVGGNPMTVWIADTPDRRRLGLMHVKHMAEDHGMLFVYPEADHLAFWMKNTYIPLSLAYITGDGRIDQILDMEPLTTTGHPSRGAVRLVLEVNQGWFQRHHVKVGATIPGVDALRGF